MNQSHISSLKLEKPRAKLPARELLFFIGENEPQNHAAYPACSRRRFRAGRLVERRLSPFRHGGPHRQGRSLLYGLPGQTAGVCFGYEVRLSLPGAMVPVAEEKAW